jgi:2,5-furandicarboxylate decarboxylase 1
MNQLSLSTREIWFRCTHCSRESYCGQEFEQLENPEVLCPFCGKVMKLSDVRLSLSDAAHLVRPRSPKSTPASKALPKSPPTPRQDGAVKDFRAFLREYEAQFPDDVFHVQKQLHAEFECSAVAKRFDERHEYPLIIFHRVINRNGRVAPFRASVNVVGDRQKMAFALDSDIDRVGAEWARRLQTGKRPPLVVPRQQAPCKENVSIGDAVDLWNFPVLRIHEMDPGHYISAGLLTCYDPDKRAANCAYHRGFVAGPREIRCYLSPGTHNAWNYRAHEELGQPMKVAYWIGHHPAATMGAHTHMGYPSDHYETAGALLGQPLRVTASETLGDDFLVPADAEVVIEGIMRPGNRAPEGPFGEYPRYYGPQIMSPVMEVTAVTYRNDAIWDTLMVGMVHDYAGVQAENVVYEVVRRAVPQLKRVYLPRSGNGRFHVYLQMKKLHDGQPRAAIMATLAAFEWIKHVVVVDEDIDIYDDAQVLWAIATRSQWDRDLIVMPGCLGSQLDPSAARSALSTKGGIDATVPASPQRYPLRVNIPADVLSRTRLEDIVSAEQLARRGRGRYSCVPTSFDD